MFAPGNGVRILAVLGRGRVAFSRRARLRCLGVPLAQMPIGLVWSCVSSRIGSSPAGGLGIEYGLRARVNSASSSIEVLVYVCRRDGDISLLGLWDAVCYVFHVRSKKTEIKRRERNKFKKKNRVYESS